MSDTLWDTQFEDDTSLSLEIEAFVQMLATSRLLQFTLAETTARFPEMTTAGLILPAPYIAGGMDGTFDNDPRIMYACYRHFSPLFNYTLSSDVTAMHKFAHQVGDYFHTTSRHGVSKLVDGLFGFLLQNAQKAFGLNLTAYALSMQLRADSKLFYSFFTQYFATILDSGDSFESVWDVCSHYAGQEGVPESFSAAWNMLAKFVHSLVDHHKAHLPVIRSIATQEQSDPALKLLYLQLLNKITLEGAVTVEELVDWLDDETSRTKALTLLVSQKIDEAPLRQRLVDKLRCLPLHEGEKLERLRVLLNLLDSSAADTPAFRDQLITEIKAHFQDPAIVDLSASLQHLGRSNEATDAVNSIIDEVLHSQQFKPDYLRSMAFFFANHKDFVRFFHFLRSACLKLLAARKVVKSSESVIYLYRTTSPVDFEKQAILLCTDSEGVCRLLGQELLFDTFQLDQTATITYDVGQLDMLQQYKLVISLLTQLRPINHTIPIVLKLLDSPSPIVQELIACKLEALIPSYQYEVIEQVKNNLPDTHTRKAPLLARLEDTWSRLAAILHKKNTIKEFDPHLSETEKMRAYHRATAKASQQISKKAKKEHGGLFNTMKSRQVARGGGTVMPDGRVNPMMSHSITFTLPRTMFITPERNDYEMEELYSSNWDNEFEQWEQIILSSGSI
ncbi:hypothetical protein [Chitinophaga sp.]|uniref:hypothetical protein n=1 Tax=Chitinophaga sp. TaxID=1869181 RepID=UPI0031D23826